MVTKTELVQKWAEASGLSQAEAKRLLDNLGDVISDCLVSGEDVSWVGFGSFVLVQKQGRTYPDFKGGKVQKPAKMTVRFDEHSELQNRLNTK